MSKKIALIDGYGFVFRAYHSLPPLTRSDKVPVGAVYGFTNMLIKLLASLHVSHAAVVFDAGSKTFRHDIFPDYKANRPPCPEDLIPQFPIVRQAAESLNLSILEKTGFEADDIIATIAKKSAKEGFEVLIVSSDKDLMQLIDDNISMYDAMKNKIITAKEVEEKFFVAPSKVLDVLALMGDASDNIPGVKGIGPKTAAELILEFGNLENLLARTSEIKQEKRRQMLEGGIEKAKLSKILASLKEDVEVGISLSDLEVKAIEPHKLIAFLEDQGFRSLVERVKKEFNLSDIVIEKKGNLEEKKVKKTNFTQIKKIEILNQEIANEVYEKAILNGLATIDLYQENFLTISTTKNNSEILEIFFVEIAKSSNANLDLFSFEENKNVDQGFIYKLLEKILSEDSIKKIFFDFKDSAKKLLNILQDQINPAISLDKNFKSFADISLINHLLNSSIKNDLRELININLEEDLQEMGFNEIFNEISKNNEPKSFTEKNKKIEFLIFKNYAIYQLYEILFPRIFDLKLNETYFSYELPLLEALAEIENNGIKIDVNKLQNLSQEFSLEIKKLSEEIYQKAGEEFNIASTQQLGKILFEKLGLTSAKKSKKTGAYSTASEVLEELDFQGHKIAGQVLEFRKFSKLKNTYTDALPKEINPKTGRIHTHLSSISTITGRLSSSNPNLQNIPIKTFEGRKIRQAFIAKKNNLLISADYSQIELRVIAHVAKIENLIQAFKDNKDIHKITASQVFGIPENEISDDLRSKAKAINFGIIYGISAFGLARQLDISRQEASDYIKSYLKAYPGIDEYMKNYINLARQDGFVKTISGRKCFISNINDKNPMIRNEAERLAINAPIQGSAADIIKMAMIRLNKKLKENNFAAKIVLQIHDELLIEAPENEVEEIKKLLKNQMESAIMLDVPLRVDIEVGSNWK